MPPFRLRWTPTAEESFCLLENAVKKSRAAATGKHKKLETKSSEGLFKQVVKTLRLLAENPRHPSLQTHKYDDIQNPFTENEPVFEAYVQNRSPGAYRVFWCYGPGKKEITIIAITSHP